MGRTKNNSISVFLLIVLLGLAAATPAKQSERKSNRDDPPAPTPSPDFDCPNNEIEGGFYPHQTSCSKYYHCSHGDAWLEECDDDLHFNVVTEQCDWPENANCQIGGSTTTPRPGSSTTGGPGITTTGHPFMCPAPDGNFADPRDCTAFYACANGQIIGHQYCPDGLYFNPNISNCDYEWNVDCATRNKKQDTHTK